MYEYESHFLFPKVEFLDINFTKDSSFFLRSIHSPFHWQILKKTIFYSVFNYLFKKIAKQKNSSLFMTSIL